jgi:hypothetical protein
VGGDIGRGVGLVIVGEFGKGEPFVPVIMKGVHIETKVDFKFLIDALCLAIGLWMIGGRGGSLDSTGIKEARNELVYKLWSTIAGYGSWYTKVSNPILDKDIGISLERECGSGGYEDSFLGGFVNYDQDGIAIVRDQQRRYEIDRDILERDGTRVNGMERGFWLVAVRFVRLTWSTSSDIFLDIGSQGIPGVMSADELNGLVDTRMTR